MALSLSVVIPTYRRGAILLRTIDELQAEGHSISEIVVVDQTESHPPEVEAALLDAERSGIIRRIVLSKPSIPISMNRGIEEARSDLVLFLDDDILPVPGLAAAHIAAYRDVEIWAVAGQVLQPGEVPIDIRSAGRHGTFRADLQFRFSQSNGEWVENVMAGNLSVRRERALEVGGFDENFTGASYRFETDFARRIVKAGGRIWFEPSAAIHHLKAGEGGLRAFGDWQRMARPHHTQGDYYFAMLHAGSLDRIGYFARRLRSSLLSRSMVRHPQWLAARMVGEFRGWLEARKAIRRGRRLGIHSA